MTALITLATIAILICIVRLIVEIDNIINNSERWTKKQKD